MAHGSGAEQEHSTNKVTETGAKAAPPSGAGPAVCPPVVFYLFSAIDVDEVSHAHFQQREAPRHRTDPANYGACL